MEGYKKSGSPDVNFWFTEISAGEEFRRNFTHQNMWATYRNYYRNKFRQGLFTKNIYFMMRRSMVPRTYMRNPMISVTSKKPGATHAALAKIMERTFNSLMKSMDIKGEMKKLVDTGFTTGTGVGKLGFGGLYSPTPNPEGTEVPRDKQGGKVEHRSGILDNMPWFMSIDPGSFVLPNHCTDEKSAYFQAQWIRRYKDDVQRDPRLKKISKFKTRTMALGPKDPIPTGSYFGQATRDEIDLLEIRDRRNQKVTVLAPHDTDEVLYFEDDELQTEYSSPYYLYSPNMDDEVVWGVSDAGILYPFQQQLNEIKTKMHLHMRQSIVKILAEKGVIKPEEVAKMQSENIQAVIEVANIHKIDIMQAATIPQELFAMEQNVMNDVREVMGFSRNAFGDYQARSHGPTTVETNAVNQALELRIDERRDILSDILVRLFEDIQLIIYRHWNEEQVTKVIGKEGHALWVKFTGKMLEEGQYEISINPDTAVTETKAVREERAKQYYQMLQTNPLLDSHKLTKYVLGELPGVAFDDLLLEQQPENQEPLTPEQLGQNLQIAG